MQNTYHCVLEHDIIWNDLTDEVQEFSGILADEVTSHNRGVLALCVGFIDRLKKIEKKFLLFIPSPKITGDVIFRGNASWC